MLKRATHQAAARTYEASGDSGDSGAYEEYTVRKAFRPKILDDKKLKHHGNIDTTDPNPYFSSDYSPYDSSGESICGSTGYSSSKDDTSLSGKSSEHNMRSTFRSDQSSNKVKYKPTSTLVPSSDMRLKFDSSADNSPSDVLLSRFDLKRDFNTNKEPNLEALIDKYREQLINNLSFLTIQESTKPQNAHHILYQIGLTYKRLARIDDLSDQHEAAVIKRQEALVHLNKAIALAENQKLDNHSKKMNTELAKYYAYKAKCLYYMDSLIEAEEAYHKSIEYQESGLAKEALGYILRAKGDYAGSLYAFEEALLIDSDYSKHHYIVSLYNQAIALATLGRQAEALSRFEIANQEPYERIDMEDQIIVMEMRKPEYEDILRILASLAMDADSTERLIRSRHNSDEDAMPEELSVEIQALTSKKASIKKGAEALTPGNTRAITFELTQQLLAMKEELDKVNAFLAAQQAREFDNKEKVRLAVQRFASEDVEEIDKAAIKADPYLNTYYTTIKKDLVAAWSATEVISSTYVPSQKTGTIGFVAKCITHVKYIVPGPVKKALTGIAAILKAVDEFKQQEYIENYYNIAADAEEMGKLSKAIAIRLAFKRKNELDYSDNTNAKSIKKIASDDAKNMSELIKKIIFEKKITVTETNEKVNWILALAELQQNNNNDDDFYILPQYTRDIAALTLKKIKHLNNTEYLTWKGHENLEKRFVDYLAYSIYSKGIPKDTNYPLLANKLARTFSHDPDIVSVKHKTFTFKSKKASMSETFLSRKDYFNAYVAESKIDLGIITKPDHYNADLSLEAITDHLADSSDSSLSSHIHSSSTIELAGAKKALADFS